MQLRFALVLGSFCSIALASAIMVACAEPNLDDGVEGGDLPLPDRVASLPGTGGGGPDTSAGPTDAGEAAVGEGGDGGDAGVLHAFVSSTVVNATLGGLAGADAKCNALAKAQGLPGSYRAWLSISGTDAKDRVTSAGPWYRADDTTVVIASRAELLGGTIAKSLNIDEKGGKAGSAEDRVWTATLPNGTYSGPDCNQWTGMGDGRVGEAEFTDTRWSNSTIEPCDNINRLYCFQL